MNKLNEETFDDYVMELFNSITKTIYLNHKNSGLTAIENFTVATTAIGYFVEKYATIIDNSSPDLTKDFERFITECLNGGKKESS